jgi:hypothetical protein
MPGRVEYDQHVAVARVLVRRQAAAQLGRGCGFSTT